MEEDEGERSAGNKIKEIHKQNDILKGGEKGAWLKERKR